jgi:hypothetical protein
MDRGEQEEREREREEDMLPTCLFGCYRQRGAADVVDVVVVSGVMVQY